MKLSREVNEAIEYVSSIGISDSLIIRACKDLSIDRSHLLPKSIEEFLSTSSSKEMAEVWCKHYEARRRAKLLVLGKHLIDNHLFTPPVTKKQITRSLSSSPNRRPISRSTPREIDIKDSDPQIETIKNNIIKKLTVEKNLKVLKIEEEKRKKLFEEKLQSKSCRSPRKVSNLNEIRFQRHERRIKEILLKKYMEIENHERNAMSSVSYRREETKTPSQFFSTPRKAFLKVLDI